MFHHPAPSALDEDDDDDEDEDFEDDDEWEDQCSLFPPTPPQMITTTLITGKEKSFTFRL